MLALMPLVPALPSKEDTNKDASLPSPHLMVPVDHFKGLGDEGYYFYSVLNGLGTTYNFISQFVMDKLG